MQDLDNRAQARRTSDFTDKGKLPTLQDAWQHSVLAHTRVSSVEVDIEKLKRAFLKDDLGTPDMDGHRKSHAVIEDANKLIKEYKVGMTKDLLRTIGAMLLGAMTIGFLSYLKQHFT